MEAWHESGLCKPYQTKEWVLKAFSTPTVTEHVGSTCNLQNQEGKKIVLDVVEGADLNPKREEGPRDNFQNREGSSEKSNKVEGVKCDFNSREGHWEKVGLVEGAESQLGYREGVCEADKVAEGPPCNSNVLESISGGSSEVEDLLHIVDCRALN